ncbi:hypothetical protein [Bradyrhizobium liaoningense]
MQSNLTRFKSDRKFSLMSYEASHGPLLLRSGKTDKYPTRIDVVILDVRALEIRSWFEGFEIAQAEHTYLNNFRSNPIEMMETGLNVYAISGQRWQGFILGGKLLVREDEADIMAPSALLSNFGIP